MIMGDYILDADLGKETEIITIKPMGSIQYDQAKRLTAEQRYSLILEETTIDFNKVSYNWNQCKKCSISLSEYKSLLRTYLSKYFKKYYSYSDYVTMSYKNPVPLVTNKGYLAAIELETRWHTRYHDKDFQTMLKDFNFLKLRYSPEYYKKEEKEYEYDQETERKLIHFNSDYETREIKLDVTKAVNYNKLEAFKF